MENHIFYGSSGLFGAFFTVKIHYKWQFSIAMLVYQRVLGSNMISSGMEKRLIFFGEISQLNMEKLSSVFLCGIQPTYNGDCYQNIGGYHFADYFWLSPASLNHWILGCRNGTRNGVWPAEMGTGQSLWNIIWLVTSIPLKNDGVRQLRWLFPRYGQIKFMFQTTNQWLLTIINHLLTIINHHYPILNQPVICWVPTILVFTVWMALKHSGWNMKQRKFTKMLGTGGNLARNHPIRGVTQRISKKNRQDIVDG